jgi:hypothetical protein
MTPQSAKAKGRNLQKLVAKKLRESFPQFTELDISSTSMGVSGEDVRLSQPAKNLLQIQIECKNRAKIAVFQDYAQAQTHGNAEPVVVLKQNHSKPLVLIDLDYYIKLLKRSTLDVREEL